MARNLHEIASKRDGHRFVLRFDAHPASLSRAEQQLGAWASGPMPFAWEDAANLSRVIRAFRKASEGIEA